MNFSRSSLSVFLSNVGLQLITFVGIIVFTRQLTPAAIGAYFLFEALLSVMAFPADLGINDAVEKRISEGESPNGIYATALVLKAGPLVAILGMVVAFADTINAYLGESLALLLAAGVVLQELAFLGYKTLNGELRVAETAGLKFIRKVIWLVVAELLLLFGFGASSLPYGIVVGTGFVAILAYHWQNTEVGQFGANEARSIVNFSKFGLVLSVGGYVYSWTDVLVIGLLLDQSFVGYYEIAWRVSLVVMMLGNALSTTIFPQISKWDAADEIDRIESLIQRALTPALVLVIPAFFGVLVLSEDILGLVFGPSYRNASLVLILLMFNTLIQAIHVILGRALPALNRPDFAAKATAASIGVNFILNIVLVWQFGFVGAAVATILASLVGGGLHVMYTSRLLSIRVPWLEVGWCVLAAVVMVVPLYLVDLVISVKTLPELIAVIFGAVLVYFGVIITHSQMRKDLLVQYQKIRNIEDV
jgi:O-antigen/teichoic acid export membrane protein